MQKITMEGDVSMRPQRYAYKKDCCVEGYLTVYLTLIMTVMLSLYLALIEGARSNAVRLESECVADIALNSVFAEYHQELYRQYNLFAIDTSYGTFRSGSKHLEEHLKDYLDKNFSMDDIFLQQIFYKDFLALSTDNVDVTRALILSDYNGAVFRAAAVEAIKDDVGIGLLEQLNRWTQTVSDNGLLERDIAAEKDETDRELESYDGRVIQVAEDDEETKEIDEEEWVVVDINNPTDGLEQIRRRGILDAVIGPVQELPAKTIDTDNLIQSRMELNRVSQGNYALDELSKGKELEERFFFQEYLLKYMGRYGCTEEENALLYQIEYLLQGEESDIANLRNTANALCAIREVANVIYIYSDEVKCAEAEVLGAVLAAICHMPELSSLFKHTILLGWAYAESLYDVKTLLAGGRIPLLKDDASWHYDLSSALRLDSVVTDETQGLSYADYLRILMSFEDIDTLTLRAMNMVEADIRLTAGNQYFRLDACYQSIEVSIKTQSSYGYSCEMTGRKKY